MEFVRRQQALIREEQAVEVNVQGSPVGGSGEDTLEKEIVKYLLKSGHKYFEQKEGKAYVPINVAEYIFNTLDRDKIELQDKALRELYKTYYELWQRSGVGEEIPQQHFVNHYLPEVCDVAVDLLTSDDNYVASDLWRRKEVHVESEVELLAAGVPKVIMIYQSKVIDRLIRAQHQRLQEELTDEEEAEVMKILNRLNKTKLTLAKLSRRLIL
jgi:DNA primase